MAHVTVHVFDEIRARLGRKQVAVELAEPATVGDLLRALAAQVDPLFAELGETEASEYAVNAIVLDGRRLKLGRDDGAPVLDGAQVYLIPPIAGGAP